MNTSISNYEDKNPNELMKALQDQYEKKIGFIDTLRHELNFIWKKIDEHPFLLEIEQGILPIYKYRTYAIQNYYYFTEYFRSKSAAAAHAQTTADTLLLKRWITYVGPEFEKYLAIVKTFGITEKELKQSTIDPTIPLPAARAYVDYVYKIYSTGSLGEIAACVLACAWSYSPKEIGGLDCPLRVAQSLADHYKVDRDIALSYGNYARQKPHLLYLTSLKNTIEKEVQRGKDIDTRISDIFRRASEYEYMWWDLAYKHEPNKTREIGSYY